MPPVPLSLFSVVLLHATAVSAKTCHRFYFSLVRAEVQTIPNDPDGNVVGDVQCELCTSSDYQRCNATVQGGNSQLIAGFINLAYLDDGRTGNGNEVFIFCGDNSPGMIIPPRGIVYPEPCKPYVDGKSVNINMRGRYLDTSKDISKRLADMQKRPERYYFNFHSIASWEYWQTTDKGRVGMARGVMTLAPGVSLPAEGGGGTVIGVVAALAAIAALAGVGAVCYFRRARDEEGTFSDESSDPGVASSEEEACAAFDCVRPMVARTHQEDLPWEVMSSLDLRAATHKSTASGSELQAPAGWVNRNLGENFAELEPVDNAALVELQRMLDATWKQVRTRDRDASKQMPTRLLLKHALRIEHAGMWSRYSDYRKFIQSKRARNCTSLAAVGGKVKTADFISSAVLKDDVNEVYLWHGTSPHGALGIIKTGFKLDLAGSSTGTMYGNGAYFAECSSKSDEYARDDGEKGSIYKHLFCLLLCRVTLGELLHMTTGGEATHAMIKAAVSSGAYDSVLGNREASAGTYREFVAYDERQVYPEYVLLYSHVFEYTPTPSGTIRTAETGSYDGHVVASHYTESLGAVPSEMLSTWKGV